MAHGDRSVDVFVRKLRLKLQTRSAGWNYIHTHFGIGYRFEAEPVSPDAELAERVDVDDASPARSQAFHSSATGS
jgi:DNA-binding winged helix-turn-helix (wHTH) protein